MEEKKEGELVETKAHVVELAPRRWAKQDRELEAYCRRPWLRYGGNLRDGNHRTVHPRLDELEAGWGRDGVK